MGQGAGIQVAAAAVRSRLETLRATVVKTAAEFTASPSILSVAAAVLTSSTWNWTQAARMGAPRGIATPAKRMPTVCTPPSSTSSRSLLVRLTLPLTASSASSAFAATRTSTVRDTRGGGVEVPVVLVVVVVLLLLVLLEVVVLVKLVDEEVLLLEEELVLVEEEVEFVAEVEVLLLVDVVLLDVVVLLVDVVVVVLVVEVVLLVVGGAVVSLAAKTARLLPTTRPAGLSAETFTIERTWVVGFSSARVVEPPPSRFNAL